MDNNPNGTIAEDVGLTGDATNSGLPLGVDAYADLLRAFGELVAVKNPDKFLRIKNGVLTIGGTESVAWSPGKTPEYFVVVVQTSGNAGTIITFETSPGTKLVWYGEAGYDALNVDAAFGPIQRAILPGAIGYQNMSLSLQGVSGDQLSYTLIACSGYDFPIGLIP